MSRTPSQNKLKMVQISISLSEPLVKEIDKMAKVENRNRSNFISNLCIEALKGNILNLSLLQNLLPFKIYTDLKRQFDQIRETASAANQKIKTNQ